MVRCYPTSTAPAAMGTFAGDAVAVAVAVEARTVTWLALGGSVPARSVSLSAILVVDGWFVFVG
jgi:uncharacterized membrane protein